MELLNGKSHILSIIFFFLSALLCAQTSLSQGYEAYRNEEWDSAVLFLKKAQGLGDLTDEALYMLIRAEVQTGSVELAQSDCRAFLEKFSESPYLSYIRYQDGKLLHVLGENERAISALGKFCEENPDHPLFPAALYFMAESFYDEYNFDSAKKLYLRVVTDFPVCANAQDARHRLELIENRRREEKLLHLLKVIGEESLSAREEYDRQFRMYKSEDKYSLEKQLYEANSKIRDLESQVDSDEADEGGYHNADVEALKEKARRLQYLLEELENEE